MNQLDIKIVLRQCVEMLVLGNIHGVESAGMNGRLSVEEICLAIQDYPGTMTLPPASAYDRAHIYMANADGWQNVEFELWYEGRESDLTLSIRVRDSVKGPQLQIQDIHVL